MDMSGVIVADMDEKLIEKLNLFINKLPTPEKSRPILFLENKLFSWKDILEELKKGGELSNKIMNKIREMLK